MNTLTNKVQNTKDILRGFQDRARVLRRYYERPHEDFPSRDTSNTFRRVGEFLADYTISYPLALLYLEIS